eukprot:1158250-Pelagomonas_calceolata.AAC.6
MPDVSSTWLAVLSGACGACAAISGRCSGSLGFSEEKPWDHILARAAFYLALLMVTGHKNRQGAFSQDGWLLASCPIPAMTISMQETTDCLPQALSHVITSSMQGAWPATCKHRTTDCLPRALLHVMTSSMQGAWPATCAASRGLPASQ